MKPIYTVRSCAECPNAPGWFRRWCSSSGSRGIRILVLLLALAGLVLGFHPAAHAAPPPPARTTAAHYLVFVLQEDGTVHPTHAARVRLRGELRGRGAVGAAGASRERDEVSITLRDAKGAVRFADSVGVPRWLRGEFHGQGPGAAGEYAIDAHMLADPSRAFVVRIPVVAGASLTLESAAFRKPARFDVDALAGDPAMTSLAAPSVPSPLPGWTSGSATNRVDLLILGDGYTSAEESRFNSDVLGIVDGFFGITPYAEYRNYVNVSALFTPSSQSGADQPAYSSGCTDYSRVQSCCQDTGAMATTPITVSTAFDATFCSYRIQRLITVDYAKVLAAAAAAPDWDRIMVIVNTPTYGGSGGVFSVLSVNPSSVDVAQHEHGHSFTDLADEYPNAYPGYPACSDVTASDCEANVTDQTTRALIKWSRWIPPAQPVPSTSPPAVATRAGLWEGARYQSAGMRRQGYACLMRQLAAPFCDVASEAYAIRLYEGGWGVPADGIDNIEPGSESPAPGSVSLPYPGGPFRATVLGPQFGPNLTATWYLDGALVATQSLASGATASHELTTTAGLHTLELRVTDNSPILHPTLRSSFSSRRTWSIAVGADLCGNGARDLPQEECDDGNIYPGDCCSPTCRFEPVASACAGDHSVCLLNVCNGAGACVHPALPDGTPCDDLGICTTGDHCESGTCSGIPVPDLDADGHCDRVDNCPSFSNPDQLDSDGSGRGNLCECGDQNGDATVNVADIVAINLAIFTPALATPLCDANNDGLCNIMDIVSVNNEMFSPGNTSICPRQPLPGP